MQIRRQMTGIYHPCSTFTSQSAHFCDIFSKCKFEQMHFISQCRISCNLGPDSAVGEKGKKRAQIGKISASEGSQVVSWGGGKGGKAWRQSLMPPFHDTRFRYHALIGQMSSCWQIRGAVDSIVYFQYNAHTIRKRFFKTVRVKGGMSLRNGMWHGLRNDIIMRNVKYGNWRKEIN